VWAFSFRKQPLIHLRLSKSKIGAKTVTTGKKIATAALVACLGWVAWVVWVTLNIDPNPQLYPPIKHADGTSEYWLIYDDYDPDLTRAMTSTRS
jgi:hypothetical protein